MNVPLSADADLLRGSAQTCAFLPRPMSASGAERPVNGCSLRVRFPPSADLRDVRSTATRIKVRLSPRSLGPISTHCGHCSRDAVV